MDTAHIPGRFTAGHFDWNIMVQIRATPQNLALIWLELNFLDLGLTLATIRLGGGEFMPVMKWLLEAGIGYFIGVKILGALIAVVILGKMKPRVGILCNIIMAIIVFWNILALILSLGGIYIWNVFAANKCSNWAR
jgi:hypothetical protein